MKWGVGVCVRLLDDWVFGAVWGGNQVEMGCVGVWVGMGSIVVVGGLLFGLLAFARMIDD